MRATKTKIKAKATDDTTATFVTNITCSFTHAVTDLSTTPKSMDNSTSDGLLEVKSILTEDDVAEIVSFLVGEWFTLNTKKTEELKDEIVYYFNESGVANEDTLSIMTDPFVYSKPSKIKNNDNLLTIITVPVILLL